MVLPWIALGAFVLVLQNGVNETVAAVSIVVSILSWLSAPIAAMVALVTARSVSTDLVVAQARMKTAMRMAGVGVLSWLVASWLAWEAVEHHAFHWGML